MRLHSILDAPYNPPEPDQPVPLAKVVVTSFALVNLILLFIVQSHLPGLHEWEPDFTNFSKTVGQFAFVVMIICPLALILARQWYGIMQESTLRLFLFFGAYMWLHSNCMILAVKFWGEPHLAGLNQKTLNRAPIAVAMYLAVHLFFAYIHWRRKNSKSPVL